MRKITKTIDSYHSTRSNKHCQISWSVQVHQQGSVYVEAEGALVTGKQTSLRQQHTWNKNKRDKTKKQKNAWDSEQLSYSNKKKYHERAAPTTMSHYEYCKNIKILVNICTKIGKVAFFSVSNSRFMELYLFNLEASKCIQ